MGIKLNDLNQPKLTIGNNDGLLSFGDGVFETMLASQAEIINWQYHYQRLSHAAERLNYQLASHDQLITALTTYLQQFSNKNPSDYFVLKLIVGRGDVGRGFKTIANTTCHYFVKCMPYTFNPALYQGVNIIKCQQKLGHNPLLAGLKRVSAMDYVLLRSEIDKLGAFDGLVYAIDDNLVECSNANVFLINGRQLLTPNLAQCGVAGTLRAQLLERCDVQITQLTERDINNADSVFISNAVMGIIPVAAIDGVNINCDLSRIYQTIAGINHPCLKHYADSLSA